MTSSCAATAPFFLSEASAVPDLSRWRASLDADLAAFDQRQDSLAIQQFGHLHGSVVKRLPRDVRGSWSRALRCMRPPAGEEALDERALLSLKPRRGRLCSHPLCARRCGLHVRELVLLPDEATALVAHADRVVLAQGAPHDSTEYHRVDFGASAALGARAEHLLGLRVAERMRRIAARVFRLPADRVRVAEHFWARHGASRVASSTVHVDEGVDPNIHFSSVLYLGGA